MSNGRYMPEYIRWVLRHLNTSLRSGAVPKMQSLKVWQWYKMRLTYSDSKTRQQLQWLSIFRLLSLFPFPSKQSDFQMAGHAQKLKPFFLQGFIRMWSSQRMSFKDSWILTIKLTIDCDSGSRPQGTPPFMRSAFRMLNMEKRHKL